MRGSVPVERGLFKPRAISASQTIENAVFDCIIKEVKST
jgi:hypothetical protein